MLRSLLFVLALISLFGSAVSAQEGTPLFRHIGLGPWGTVELAKPFVQADRIGIPEGPGTFRLRPGTFGGAAKITIHVAPDARVTAMHFEYDPEDSDFEGYVRNVSTSYGPPTLSSRTAADGEPEEVAHWEDSATVLEVVRRTRTDGVEVFVAMFDRVLAGR